MISIECTPMVLSIGLTTPILFKTLSKRWTTEFEFSLVTTFTPAFLASFIISFDFNPPSIASQSLFCPLLSLLLGVSWDVFCCDYEKNWRNWGILASPRLLSIDWRLYLRKNQLWNTLEYGCIVRKGWYIISFCLLESVNIYNFEQNY